MTFSTCKDHFDCINLEASEKVMNNEEVMNDVKNFSKEPPVQWVGEVVGVSQGGGVLEGGHLHDAGKIGGLIGGGKT